MFQTRVLVKSKYTFCAEYVSSETRVICETMWKIMMQTDRLCLTINCGAKWILFACQVTKTRHNLGLMLFPFPQQILLREGASVLRSTDIFWLHLNRSPVHALKCEHNRYTICYMFRHFLGAIIMEFLCRLKSCLLNSSLVWGTFTDTY
jgi:hypothetical protein